VISGVPYEASGEDSTLWADFQDKVAGLALDEATRERLLAEARTALVEVVEPAYERLIAAVEAQAESAAEADGIWICASGNYSWKSGFGPMQKEAP